MSISKDNPQEKQMASTVVAKAPPRHKHKLHKLHLDINIKKTISMHIVDHWRKHSDLAKLKKSTASRFLQKFKCFEH